MRSCKAGKDSEEAEGYPLQVGEWEFRLVYALIEFSDNSRLPRRRNSNYSPDSDLATENRGPHYPGGDRFLTNRVRPSRSHEMARTPSEKVHFTS